MPETPAHRATTSGSEGLAERSIALARRWVDEAAHAHVDPAAQRLAGVLRDEQGLPFTMGFVDGVMRPESLSAAASNLHRIAPIVPEFLPWYLRVAARVGGAAAPILPMPVVPIARRVLREMVGHLIVDARPAKLGSALEKIRERGAKVNLNLLGEAVLGEREAKRRLDGIHELIRRPDVDYVSVKVSAIMSRISMWAFDRVVDEVCHRLLPLYLTAAETGTFINLDMEEYRDLDLTIAVFTRILEDPRLRGTEAGIVLQAYLPDSIASLRELTAWAKARVEHNGARIKVRLVKGANLAMERVDAAMHGWTQAPYGSKVEADANYLRCLDEALRPESLRAVRIGVAGHNLFSIAHAWLLAQERDAEPGDVEFEMLLGMAQGQVEAVSREVGPVLLYVPVVKPAEFDVAISYLVRRLEEAASAENFLSAAFELDSDPALFERERDRYLAAVALSGASSLRARPRRTQNRLAPPHESIMRPPAPTGGDPDDATQAVLTIARGSGGVSDSFVDTAVYARFESRDPELGAGAAGFSNTPDTDPALPANREWADGILARIASSTVGERTLADARITTAEVLEETIGQVRRGATAWGARPAAERADVLGRIAAALEAHRAELIEVAAAETGKVLTEGDIEVSEAVDFAKYYGAKARELDAVPGAAFVPSRLTVVTPPWNFPIAIPAGGVLAALAAGSGVVFKPAPQARRCAAVIAEILWAAGVPRDVLALVDIDEGQLGEHLVAHPDVDRVILTGSFETAELFRSWRPDLPLLAETSGKNAIIVTPSADLDLAAADIVRSAFGHAGQKCSAASLAILVGAVGRSKRFARQLADATRSLRVGWPTDPLAEVGPVIERPTGKLKWALAELEGDEQWLIKPELDPHDRGGRLWRPGIRTGVERGSRFHQEEFFGPVLGVMYAPTLAQAIAMQNDVAYGLTAGLHTQSPDDLAIWLDRVQAGNLYVNRGITGAIVQRQPFGGWKRSSVGPGAKAGGPNYLIGLGRWRATDGGAPSKTLHLRGLDTRITSLIESAQPSMAFKQFEWLRRAALSDALAWDREFGRVRDVSRLGVERNLFRYRPMPVAIRATAGTALQELLRVVIAAVRAGSDFTLSAPGGLPAAVRRALGELKVPVFVETDAEWVARAAGTPEGPAEEDSDILIAERVVRASRVRLVGPSDEVRTLHRALAEAIAGDPEVAVYDGEVTTAGRIELLPFVHEQSVTITAHRFGNPDDWSEAVI